MTKRRIANRCLREKHPQHKSRIQTLLLPFSGWKNTFATLVCLMWMKGLLRPVLLEWFPLVLSAQRASSFLRRWCTDLNRPRILYRTRVFWGLALGSPSVADPRVGRTRSCCCVCQSSVFTPTRAYTLKTISLSRLLGALLSRDTKDSTGLGTSTAPRPEIWAILQ